jgi:serine/threonine-protein kinase
MNTAKAAETPDEDEEDPEGEVDPKLEKALIIGSIAVAIIIGVIIIYLLGRFVGLWGGSSSSDDSPEPTTSAIAQESGEPEESSGADTVVVPSIQGMTQEEAETLLDSAGLNYTFKSKSSTSVEPGEVVSTNPAIGTEVSTGDTITVYIRPTETELQSVWGMTPEEAEKALTDSGFVPKRGSDTYSEKTEEGKVSYTEPNAGESVAAGATVTYHVSKGAERVIVPDLVGKTKSQAKSALEKVGLKLGNVSSAYSENITKNRVCVQSKANGAEVKKGASVDITLSLGQEKTYSYQLAETLRIDNLFDYESDPAATIKIVLVQDGKTKTILEQKMDYSDFPLNFAGSSIQGYSGSQGQLVVYKNKVQVDSYNVTFKKVAD